VEGKASPWMRVGDISLFEGVGMYWCSIEVVGSNEPDALKISLKSSNSGFLHVTTDGESRMFAGPSHSRGT
jgi:hypothetical protein